MSEWTIIKGSHYYIGHRCGEEIEWGFYVWNPLATNDKKQWFLCSGCQKKAPDEIQVQWELLEY